MSEELESNLADLEPLLSRFRAEQLGHFIGGQPVSGGSGQSFDNATPIDNSTIGSVAAGNAEDVDCACISSAEAFSHWRAMPGRERKTLLHKVADAIEAAGASVVLSGEMGCLMNIAGTLSRRGSTIEARHAAEVLAGMTDTPAIGAPK